MATRSIELRNQRTQQYLGWKSDAEDYGSRLRLQLIAQLSYLLDDATLQKAPLWQLRKWTANGMDPIPVSAPTLAERIEKLRQVFDKADAMVEAEPVQPVVELDEHSVRAFKEICASYYSDVMNGVKEYDMSDASHEDFDESEAFIYRAVEL